MLFTYDDPIQKSAQTMADKINRYYHSETSYITSEQLIATLPNRALCCIVDCISFGGANCDGKAWDDDCGAAKNLAIAW